MKNPLPLLPGLWSALTWQQLPDDIRTYKWQDEYRIDWNRRCAEDCIVRVEKMDIPDDGTM